MTAAPVTATGTGKDSTAAAVTPAPDSRYGYHSRNLRVAASVTCGRCGTVVPTRIPHVIFTPDLGRTYRRWCIDCAETDDWDRTPWRRTRRPSSDYFHDCPGCFVAFYAPIARSYCSDECRAAVLAERRRREPRTAGSCATCAQSFTPPRSDGRYCSAACRQKAYRRRTARHPVEVDR